MKMKHQYYILDQNRQPVPSEVTAWVKWMSQNNRERKVQSTSGLLTVNEETVEVNVSTVFLALNHAFSDADKPLLFETMIFGGPLDEHQTRCSTWEEAEVMHQEALKMLDEVGCFIPRQGTVDTPQTKETGQWQ